MAFLTMFYETIQEIVSVTGYPNSMSSTVRVPFYVNWVKSVNTKEVTMADGTVLSRCFPLSLKIVLLAFFLYHISPHMAISVLGPARKRLQGLAGLMATASFKKPALEKVKTGGEDVVTVNPDWLGVLDGVGGWYAVGVDPAIYPQTLMSRINHLYKMGADPRSVLREAWTTSFGIKGSCTCSLIFLEAQKTGIRAKLLNLGDSGILVFRKSQNSLIYRSKEQQHEFNFPYQLAGESGDHGDSPDDADTDELSVEEGDVIIAASDGLFDNVWDEDIIKIIRDHQTIQEIVSVLGHTAYHNSMSSTGRVPFFVNYARSVNRKEVFQGGKKDDITIAGGTVLRLPTQTCMGTGS